MGKLVGYLMEHLLRNEMIEESQREIYQYGLERLVNKTVSYVLLFLLAFGMHMILPSTLFFCFLFMLRGRTGGYHAATELRCFTGTVVIYVVCMKALLPLLQQQKEVLLVCFVISIVIIFLLAPVNHPNLGFSAEEMQYYKKRARLILGGEVVFIIIFVLAGVQAELIISAILGMVVCAFLLCIAKITKQEVMAHEGQ